MAQTRSSAQKNNSAHYPMPIPPLPSLVLDASTPLLQAGILENGDWMAFQKVENVDVLEALFGIVQQLLKQSHLTWTDLQSLVFCEGPGPLLSLRIGAMAMKAWQIQSRLPVYTYRNLDLAGRHIANTTGLCCFDCGTLVRRGSACMSTFQNGGRVETSMVTVESFALIERPIYLIEQRALFATPELSKTIKWHYSIKSAPVDFSDETLLRASITPEVFIPEQAEFQKWNTQRHRG
jgi:tRNA A37 threonylcarbamoyladenosine modification protein TsaB